MNFPVYILQAGGLFSAFYMVYYVLLRNSTFFQLNRIYLMAIVPISFLVPLVDWKSSVGTQYEVLLPVVDLSANPHEVSASWLSYMGDMYIVVAALLLLFFVYRLIRMAVLIGRVKKGTQQQLLPFSFFNFIYLPDSIEEEKKDAILKHELVHVNQQHSIDVVIYEIVKATLWWTPFSWMAVKSVKNNHEFIADAVASKNNKSNYSSVLLAQLLGVNCSMLANNFNYKPLIKRRLKMMKTAKSKKVSALKYALVIPIVALFATVSINQPAKAQVKPAVEKSDEDKVYDEVDVMPEFKGGMEGLINFMSTNIKYPKESGAEGKVFVQFIVDEKGNVKDANIVKGVHELLDQEALRVVNMMPAWTPGKVADKNVKVKMTLPIAFKLD